MSPFLSQITRMDVLVVGIILLAFLPMYLQYLVKHCAIGLVNGLRDVMSPENRQGVECRMGFSDPEPKTKEEKNG